MAYITWLDEDIPSRKRAKVFYECKTTDGSRKRRSKTFKPGTPLKEIRAFQRQMETEYEISDGIDYTKRTVEDFIEEYFDTYAQYLSPTTEVNYRQMAYAEKNGVVSHLGKIDLSKLTTAQVQKYSNYLTKEGLSAKSVKNHIIFLHTLYDKAMKLQYVKRERNIVSDVERPKVRRKKIESYSVEEVKTLLEIADKYANDMIRLEIYLAIGTGARRAELAALKIESIDFNKKVIHITQSKVKGTKGEVLKAPKTDAGTRDIPFGKTLERELNKAILRYNKNKLRYGKQFNDSRFLFCDEYGNPRKTSTMTNSYRRFMKAHEDEIRYLSLHSAGRHSFASIAIANGLDVKALQELLGHSDSATTLNVYSNSYADVKHNYAMSVDDTIFSKQA